MPPSKLVVQGTRWLALLAVLLLQAAFHERQAADPTGWWELVLTLAVAAAIAWRVDRRDAVRRQGVQLVLLSLLCAAPWACAALLRFATDGGRPVEATLAFSLRNVMVGLVALGPATQGLRAAGLASLFLTLIGFLWSMSPLTICLVVLYSLVGMAWLTGVCWERMSGRFAAQSQRRLPLTPVCGAVGLVAVLTGIVGLAVGSAPATTALRGFFPSSGGASRYDPFALGGVGDGDQLVAGQEDASSFGPIESELFLESKMPSLYDAINEFSEAPARPSNVPQPRAIPLAPSQIKENHRSRSQSQQAQREFSTVRRRAQSPPTAGELRSHALLYVTGPVPAHLGLQTYDSWDGTSLRDSGAARPPAWRLDPQSAGAKRWLRVDAPGTYDGVRDEVRRLVKVVNLKTDRVPAPPRLSAVHIDQLHSEQLFRLSGDGMLALEREFIPQLTVLHVASRRAAHARTAGWSPARAPADEDVDPALGALARTWAGSAEEGWPQVEAICERLRGDYVHDPQAFANDDGGAPLERFLYDTHRGPDYLFAASCAVLLRSLGYETRVVSGFYARPERYDAQSLHTAIYQDDVHFWVEIATSCDSASAAGASQAARLWEPLEPTPGFELLTSSPTLAVRLRMWAARLMHAARSHPLGTFVALTAAALAWRSRRDLVDHATTLAWRTFLRPRDLRRDVAATVRLLQMRAALRKVPRPIGVPLGRWQIFDHTDSRFLDCESQFQRVASWALYGGETAPPYDSAQTRQICDLVVARALRPALRSGERT